VANESARPSSTTEGAAARIRQLNEHILRAAMERGEQSIKTYEGLLENLAATLDAVGGRGADWLQELARAQAAGVRWVAEAVPALLDAIGFKRRDSAETTVSKEQEVPKVIAAVDASISGDESASGASGQQDLPIPNYDQLNVHEINRRLTLLSQAELSRIDAHEAHAKNRKTIRDRITTLRERPLSNGRR
jgi:hypothetical protein